MEMIPGRSEKIAQLLSAWSFLGTLSFLSFLVYPLAVFPHFQQTGNHLFNLPFSISMPGMIILGLLAVPVLLFFRWRLPRPLLFAVIVFTIMLAINLPRRLEYLDEFLVLAAYVTIPIAAAILRQSGYLSLKWMSSVAFAIWLQEIVLGGISLLYHSQPVGTTGNINWMATLLLMLSPWVLWFLVQILRHRLANNRLAIISAVLLWFIPTITLLYYCHSRSAWLALVLLPAALGVMRLRRLMHKILLVCALCLAGVGFLAVSYVWLPGPLYELVEKDVRLPLWTGTAVMMVKQPLGVGSGEFQKDFTPYRQVSSYQQRLYAADMTVHPHNEALNVGAQLGIPALLAFLIMLAPIGRSAYADPLQICARISAFFALMTSMFDMTMVQPPTDFLGFFVLGLCWPLQEIQPATDRKRTFLFQVKTLLAVLLISGTLVMAYLDLAHDIHMRRGLITEYSTERFFSQNRVEEGRAALAESISHFKESVTPVHSIIPFYKIGRLSLQLPAHTDQAEMYLKRVAAIDPNFSHLNLLFGQLSLQKRDVIGAEHYFARECAFYPRSEKAWQNMFTFSVATGRYDRSITIEKLLQDIYRERARQNFNEAGLAARTRMFAETLRTHRQTEVVGTAGELLTRIHHNFTDPLFLEITHGRTWPASLFTGGFNDLDYSQWQLRQTIYTTLESELGELPVTPERLVAWYTRQIRHQESEQFTLPLDVWNRKTGNLLSRHLLFSVVGELNRTPCIISLDTKGQPEYTYLFASQAPTSQSPGPALLMQQDKTDLKIYRTSLQTSDIEALSTQEFLQVFHWQAGQTVMFFPVEDFFLRNQILATISRRDLPFLPGQSPTIRLLALFEITGSSPPPLLQLQDYCFKGHINRYYETIRQVQAAETQQPP